MPSLDTIRIVPLASMAIACLLGLASCSADRLERELETTQEALEKSESELTEALKRSEEFAKRVADEHAVTLETWSGKPPVYENDGYQIWAVDASPSEFKGLAMLRHRSEDGEELVATSQTIKLDNNGTFTLLHANKLTQSRSWLVALSGDTRFIVARDSTVSAIGPTGAGATPD